MAELITCDFVVENSAIPPLSLPLLCPDRKAASALEELGKNFRRFIDAGCGTFSTSFNEARMGLTICLRTSSLAPLERASSLQKWEQFLDVKNWNLGGNNALLYETVVNTGDEPIKRHRSGMISVENKRGLHV